MKKKTIIIGVIIVAVIGAMTLTLVRNKKTIDSRMEVKTADTEIAVTVAAVEAKTIDGSLKSVGTAEANRAVTIASEAMGKVTEVHFKLGDFVREGAVLVQVDDDLKRLALETAQLNCDKFREDYDRYKTLRGGDAVSETQLRDMKLGFENAAIQLENAKKQLSNTQIIAPFSGYITRRNVEPGALLNTGTQVADIVDVSELKVALRIPESDVYALRQGQEASLTASVHPEAVYTGKVSHIGLQGDNAHTYPVEIIVPNSREYPLKAGTYVNVQINAGQSVAALMIPRDAIVSSVKEPSVYLIDGNVVRLTRIATGRDRGEYLEVLSGLKENDRVVTAGQINLTDGVKISIINR
jgi:RND family efflux transporter MFP subunit